MFNLVITLVAVALVAALSGMAYYFGGSAFERHSNAAQFTQLTNQMHQIQSAVEMYKTDKGVPPSAIEQLVEANYLKEVPPGSWMFSDGFVVRAADLPNDQCLEYNRKQGLAIVPLCSDPEYAQKSVCCKG